MNVKNIVKTLLALSENSEGVLDHERAAVICDDVAANFPADKALKILRAFKKKAALLAFQNSAQVAYAGELAPGPKERLERFVRSGKPHAKIEFINDKNLIAGVKISVGDRVWENSARLMLEELAQSLGA